MSRGFSGTSSFRWPDGRERKNMPVDAKIEDMLRLLQSERVLVLQAEAGSGRAIRPAQAAALRLKQPVYQVYVDGLAARFNTQRICRELGCKALPKEISVSTAEEMVDQIVQRWRRLPKGLLILGDADEQQIDIDLLLGLIKKYGMRNADSSTLVIAGGGEARTIAEYLECPQMQVSMDRKAVVTIPVRLGPGEHHSQAAARAACELFELFLMNMWEVEQDSDQSLESGTVAVYCQGYAEAKEIVSALNRLAKQENAAERLQTFICRSDMSQHDFEKVRSAVPSNVLRFVVGTDSLRPAVDLDQMVAVVDPLEARRNEVDEHGVAHRTKITISGPWATRRASLLGLRQMGIYKPVSFKSEFEQLPTEAMRASERAPLMRPAVQLASLGCKLRDFPWLGSPKRGVIDTCVKRLQMLGLLNGAEYLTGLGKQVVRLDQRRPQTGVMLLRAADFGVQPEAVVVAAAIRDGGFFKEPPSRSTLPADEQLLRQLLAYLKQQDGSWRTRVVPTEPELVELGALPPWVTPTEVGYELNCSTNDGFPYADEALRVYELVRSKWLGDSASDFVAAVRAFRAFRAERSRLNKLSYSEDQKAEALKLWCTARFIDYGRICAAGKLAKRICQSLSGKDSWQSLWAAACDPGRPIIETALTKALLSGTLDRIGRRTKDGSYQGPIGQFQLSERSGCRGEPEFVLVAGEFLRNVGTVKTDLRQFVDFAVAINPAWFAEVLPEAFDTQRIPPISYDPETDRVVQTEVTRFAGLELGRCSVPVDDQQKAQAVFVRWLLEHVADLPDELGELLRQNNRVREQAAVLSRTVDSIVLPESKEEVYLAWLTERIGAATRLAELPVGERLQLDALKPILGFLSHKAAEQ